MTDKLKYRPLDDLSDESIKSILAGDNLDELIRLPLNVGMNHPNWKYAQDICIRLTQSKDIRVRANAFRGLEYVAMTKGKLEKHLVKPLLIEALRSGYREELDILSVIRRINLCLDWNIADL